MNAKKTFSRASLFSLVVSAIYSSSIYFYLFEEITISKRGLVVWFLMFLVLYFGFALLEQTKLIQTWKSLGNRSRILSILLTPVVGFLIISIIHFDPPNPVLLLPKQQIKIEASFANNPSSSGSVIEVDGIKNGGNWISYKTNSLTGDFDLVDGSLVLSGYPAVINYRDRIIERLEINFISRPDGGMARVIAHSDEKEVDLFSETVQQKPIILEYPIPDANKFFLSSLYSISVGLLVFLFPLLFCFEKFPNLAAKQKAVEEDPIPLDSLLLSTSLIISFFLSMEWLFQITKSSFMSYYGFSEKLVILLSCLSILSLFILLFICLLYGLMSFFGRKKVKKPIVRALVIIPSLIFAGTLLLLMDNFTYTLFNFGIVSAEGFARAVYALLFLALLAITFPQVEKLTGYISRFKQKKFLAIAVFSTILISFLVTIFTGANQTYSSGKQAENKNIDSGGFPNIIYVTADGLSAKNMSLYGYERDTTPRLLELSKSSLVAVNAFTNSRNSTGSIISVFTGKYPSETRVLYPPDILQGKNSYESLIAVLRDNGYFSAQIALPHFINAHDQNLLDGFNVINGEPLKENRLGQFIPQDTYYFINLVSNRVSERFDHIFFLDDMVNAFTLVTSTDQSYNDRERINELNEMIRNTDGPLFVHIHLMGTHGPLFFPGQQIFSSGEDPKTQKDWNQNFYDDSIHEFDLLVGSVFDELAANDQLDDTLIIISSDHGMRWSSIDRIPLLIHFPDGDHARQINGNVQNMDIAPTILDYLNIEIPAWMEGASLLVEEGSIDQRPIFSFLYFDEYVSDQIVDYRKISPPFYQFEYIYLVYCHNWFRLNLRTNEFVSGIISSYENPCPTENELSDEQAFELMKNHMQNKSFDTSSLVYTGTSGQRLTGGEP